MKNFTKELKNILKEDPGAPILSPDEVRGRANTMVILTNQAPPKLLALGGSSRRAILINYEPLMITFPDQRGVYQVEPDDIVFENHHTGRDVTEAGGKETPYEKFFAGAMKKFGVSSPIELDPEDTKKFFNYVDKNWEAEEESDGSQSEGGWEDPPKLGGEPSLITPVEDVSTGKVGKKDKGSYQHAYKLALKKYQIHSADELDTPAERKGFTSYVDRLWKAGDIHRDKKESAVTEAPKSRAQRDKARKKNIQQQQKAQQQKKKEPQEKKPTFVHKVKAKAVGAGAAAQKKAGQIKAERDKKAAERDREREQKSREREREQAAAEREREQKAKEKDNGDNGNGDDDDKDKDKEKKMSSLGGFLKQAGGEVAKAAKSQAAVYGTK